MKEAFGMVKNSEHTYEKPARQETSNAEIKDKKSNAATGASAASARAISARVLAFYFRAPAKAFFRNRVE